MDLRAALGFLLVACVPAVHAADPVIAAAGDISCDPADGRFNGGSGTAGGCRQRATSELVLAGGYDAVLLLGDLQYVDGALSKFRSVFDPTWGRLGPLLRPVPGNHEYLTSGAAGYFDYFGAAAGDRSKGYYSFDLGTWHLVALNSNCSAVGGCGAGSPQLRWLTEDLTAHRHACTLAFWHHPRFSSGLHNNDATYDAFWQVLHRAGVEVVLNGHDHNYERFAPQNPAGQADPEHGIREFVVGTGGQETRLFSTLRAHSEARNDRDFGILELRLRPDGYDWKFVGLPGGTFADRGSDRCHNPPDAPRVFLERGRFAAEASWRSFDGTTGFAKAAAPAADGSGLLWFFSPANWEVMFKVLDACVVNGHYWVFAAATTTVEHTLTVTDTRTGRQKRYENPLGRASPAVTDTTAFACQ